MNPESQAPLTDDDDAPPALSGRLMLLFVVASLAALPLIWDGLHDVEMTPRWVLMGIGSVASALMVQIQALLWLLGHVKARRRRRRAA